MAAVQNLPLNVPEIQGRLRISRHVQIEHVRSGFPRAWAAMQEALRRSCVVKLQLMMLFGHWMLEHCQPWPCLPASFENMSKCWQSLLAKMMGGHNPKP